MILVYWINYSLAEAHPHLRLRHRHIPTNNLKARRKARIWIKPGSFGQQRLREVRQQQTNMDLDRQYLEYRLRRECSTICTTWDATAQ